MSEKRLQIIILRHDEPRRRSDTKAEKHHMVTGVL